ncbi:Protein of unknown function [Bacillus cytotoxicus]|uniref:Chorismate-utilising enzyme C-terminal domain-containing protein n=1 Tax=Bacillus cytotoxicus TaxID=580165 RepID=A0AAX2CDV9_9BACI|nr:Protein of unknown function [Bacillus cytotoxicus]SCN32724.1 Protein of unknown function [Bacillus cytotoxicus]
MCRKEESTSYEEVCERLQGFKRDIFSELEEQVEVEKASLSFTSSITEKEFCEMVERAKELLTNEKERAEHIMLVDLARNDIGRVSEIGNEHGYRRKRHFYRRLCTIYRRKSKNNGVSTENIDQRHITTKEATCLGAPFENVSLLELNILTIVI